jgi:hypothetical protein
MLVAILTILTRSEFMKKMVLMLCCFVIAGPAIAENNTLEKRVNSSSTQDRYKLPEYKGTLKMQVKSEIAQAKKKPNTPALTIINEPYNPQIISMEQPQSLLIRDDVPTDVTPAPMKADMVTMGSPEIIKTVETWRGRKGESLYQVLNRWSDRAGTKVTWSSMKSPRLDKDISYVGNYQDAVTYAMKTTGASGMVSEWNANSVVDEKPTRELVEPIQSYTPESLTAEPLTPEPILPVREVATLDAAEPMPLMPSTIPQDALPQRARFYALAGTSLEQVLRSWAGTQEFALVWQADHQFQVKQTVSSNGDAEDAIRDILSMYDADSTRPIGKLYRDPRTSRPVLVVKSDKSGS